MASSFDSKKAVEALRLKLAEPELDGPVPDRGGAPHLVADALHAVAHHFTTHPGKSKRERTSGCPAPEGGFVLPACAVAAALQELAEYVAHTEDGALLAVIAAARDLAGDIRRHAPVFRAAVERYTPLVARLHHPAGELKPDELERHRAGKKSLAMSVAHAHYITCVPPFAAIGLLDMLMPVLDVITKDMRLLFPSAELAASPRRGRHAHVMKRRAVMMLKSGRLSHTVIGELLDAKVAKDEVDIKRKRERVRAQVRADRKEKKKHARI